MRTLTIAAVAVAAACGEASPPGFSTGPGVTTASASTSTSSTSGADTSSTGPADDSAGADGSVGSSTGTLRDVGTVVDFGSAQPPGCKGKVDLLFLISRRGSMDTEQTQLLASFPGFVDTIEEKLADFDLHIMSANSHPGWPGWNCETYCAEDPQSCAEYGYKCNDLAWDVTPCDEAIGAGAIFNAGEGAANRHCELYGGNRYIIQGEPDLDDALDCIGKVGMSGGNYIGDAVIAALKPKINADGGCNAGFLRDDALLVLVIIADSGDESKSYPYEQYNAVMAAKGGDPDAVVVLHVTGRQNMGEPKEPGCSYQPDFLVALRQFGMMFPFYLEGDTCAPSYAPFFDAAADLIGEACGSFIPG